MRGATIVCAGARQTIAVNDLQSPAPLRDGMQRVTIYCDRMGLEVFASDGLTYVPLPFIPKADDLAIGIKAREGAAKITALEVHELRSAWERR